MSEYAAFLRGMNVGGHRISNDDLRARFEELGFGEVRTFRASGNVIFAAAGEEPEEELSTRIETGLATALGYEVPVFLRDAGEIGTIAAHRPFAESLVEASKGKLQVVLLQRASRGAGAQGGVGVGRRGGPSSRSASASCTGCRAAASSTRRSTSRRSAGCSARSRPARRARSSSSRPSTSPMG